MTKLIDDTTDEEYEVNSLDDIRGPLTVYNENGVYCHIRELIEYAKIKGVDPSELSKEEVAMFEYKE